MKPQKPLVTLVIFILTTCICISQKAITSCYGFDCRSKKWFASFAIGKSFFEPSSELIRGMNNQNPGPGQLEESDVFGHERSRAQSSRTLLPAWDIELRRSVGRKSAIAVNLGMSWSLELEGDKSYVTFPLIEIIPDKPVLRSTAWTLSTQYVIRTGKRKQSGISFGPALMIHDVRGLLLFNTPVNQQSVRPGVHAEYMQTLISSDKWELGLKLGYKRYVNDKMDLMIREMKQPGQEHPESRIVMKDTDLPLQSLHVGVVAGMKF